MAWDVRRWLAAVLLGAGLVSLAGCEYLLILEDTGHPDFVLIRLGVMRDVPIEGKSVINWGRWRVAAVSLNCTRDSEAGGGGDAVQGGSGLLFHRHPFYEGVYCEALSVSVRRDSRKASDARELQRGNYIARIGIGLLWNRRRGESAATFLQRPFGLRCRMHGGSAFGVVTVTSNEIIVPATDLVKAVSAYRKPEGEPR